MDNFLVSPHNISQLKKNPFFFSLSSPASRLRVLFKLTISNGSKKSVALLWD